MKIGILGAGVVANKMMRTLPHVDGVSCAAVASRDLAKAKNFAARYDVPKAYGNYVELMQDPKVDVVYVATPHSHHYKHMKLCIENDKHILCEKAFTLNATQAKEILDLAQKKNLFVLEGMWTRFLPMTKHLREIIDSEKLGRATSLSVSLHHNNIAKERVFNPELGGGTLLNLGVYLVNFASMLFGDNVKSITSSAVLTDTGVDAHNAMIFTYEDGKVATLNASSVALSRGEASIYCEKGYIFIPQGEKMPEAYLFDNKHKLVEKIVADPFETGFEYQLRAIKLALEEDRTECPEMSHDMTILMMERMDELRKQWGMKFPGE